MSLRIRLTRVGAKKQPSYRIVVAESNAPRDGKAIAILGHYNPLTDPYTLKVDEERTIGWLKNGAQPSETARGLLTKAGVIATYEAAPKGPPRPAKAKGEAAEETKTRRAARAKRTEPPRLVRPAARDGAAPETARPARAAATKKASATKTAGRAKAAAKPAASKAKAAKAKAPAKATAAKTATASRTAKPKAAAKKES